MKNLAKKLVATFACLAVNASVASAQQYPYDVNTPITPPPPSQIVQQPYAPPGYGYYPQPGYPQQAYPQPGYQPPAYPQPAYPQPYYALPPPPPAYPYQQPYYAPAPAPYYPGQILPPPAYYPPAVVAPARPIYRRPVRLQQPYSCSGGSCRYSAEWNRAERPRYFSIGGHLTSMSFNQQIGDQNVTLKGGGLELRFRGRGHFGLEASLDFLHGDFSLNGPVMRDSIPFQLSALLYFWKNSDANHFNIYLLGGLGVIGTTMTLNDQNNAEVKQTFTEYEAHLGVGAELRFKWFALRADVRGLSLWRDDSQTPASYYTNVDGGPVPAQSYGVQGTVGTAIWF